MKDNHGRTPLDYYTSFQERQLCNEIIELLQPPNKRKSKTPLPIAIHNTEAPPVAQIENQPLPQRTDENEDEIWSAEMNDMKAELKKDINEVKADIRQVQLDVLETKAEIFNMKSEVSEMKSDLLETKAEVLEMKSDLLETKAEVSEIKSDLLEKKAEIVYIKTEF